MKAKSDTKSTRAMKDSRYRPLGRPNFQGKLASNFSRSFFVVHLMLQAIIISKKKLHVAVVSCKKESLSINMEDLRIVFHHDQLICQGVHEHRVMMLQLQLPLHFLPSLENFMASNSYNGNLSPLGRWWHGRHPPWDSRVNPLGDIMFPKSVFNPRSRALGQWSAAETPRRNKWS